jgi:hypothetical protein
MISISASSSLQTVLTARVATAARQDATAATGGDRLADAADRPGKRLGQLGFPGRGRPPEWAQGRAREPMTASSTDQLRLTQQTTTSRTELNLALETREGDRVTLAFSRVDARTEGRISQSGGPAEGTRLRFAAAAGREALEMTVVGELSEQEQAAIGTVVAGALEVVGRLVGDSAAAPGEALAPLAADPAGLLNLSLQVSSSRSVEVLSYAAAAASEASAEAATGPAQALDSLGEAQRELVARGREGLPEGEAAKLVRALLATLLGAGSAA